MRFVSFASRGEDVREERTTILVNGVSKSYADDRLAAYRLQRVYPQPRQGDERTT